MTGLWAVYYARRTHPDWQITIVEAAHIDWAPPAETAADYPLSCRKNRFKYAEAVDRAKASFQHGPAASAGLDGVDSVRSFQAALFDSIEESLEILNRESIEAPQVHDGHIDIAQSEAGMIRLNPLVEGNTQYGYGPDDTVVHNADATKDRINVDNAHGSVFFPGTARIEPALLTYGLARVLRDRGV